MRKDEHFSGINYERLSGDKALELSGLFENNTKVKELKSKFGNIIGQYLFIEEIGVLQKYLPENDIVLIFSSEFDLFMFYHLSDLLMEVELETGMFKFDPSIDDFEAFSKQFVGYYGSPVKMDSLEQVQELDIFMNQIEFEELIKIKPLLICHLTKFVNDNYRNDNIDISFSKFGYGYSYVTLVLINEGIMLSISDIVAYQIERRRVGLDFCLERVLQEFFLKIK